MRLMDYYMTADLHEPHDLSSREFGIMKNGYMRRHLSFTSLNNLRCYLIAEEPDHVYYSVARYEDPSNPMMKEKKRIGADLIFDIDFDHLDNPSLEEAEAHAEKLWRILAVTFYIGKMMMCFSGSRGYHIHVTTDDIQGLDSWSRREIAGYFAREIPYGKPNPNYVGIDVPVTGDISRLIRLPGSIHGKSRKKCRIIKKIGD